MEKYSVDNRRLTIEYDPEIISSAELTKFLLSRSLIQDMLVREPTLEEIIRRIYTD